MHNFRCIYRISVIGLTTDNRSNLVAAFKQIKTKAKNNKTVFPLMKFAYVAHNWSKFG